MNTENQDAHQLPDPATVRAALAAAGFVQTGDRTGFYTRWEWPADNRTRWTLQVPENPRYADYPDLMHEVLDALSWFAEHGARAQRALDYLGGLLPPMPAHPGDLKALVAHPLLAHLVLDEAPGAAALLSPAPPDGPAQYRYALTRDWGPGIRMVLFMLNPSTADALHDDPTIRRCVRFAQREGCGGLVVVNVYGLRSPKPDLLATHPDPYGPDNAAVVQAILSASTGHLVVAAWGSNSHLARSGHLKTVAGWIARADVELMCLEVTSQGHPGHPLYLPNNAPLTPYTFHEGR